MNCFMCKGDLEEKQTNFLADLGHCIVVVKNVPSKVCSQCGEVSYPDEVAKQLEIIVGSIQVQTTEIAVVHYSNKVA